ncbi:LysM peptidoglycan-binding domain-containing protein [Aliiroseovarius crassostreae]|uniref:LysM peptidoglycan-binding domain-containing protein n=1 Tax=Aliiroseovarius crassostreae TaxID=154981 RepID=UPI00223B8837|nr:LysM peptidoglycan-binding domain-containing protein [Aliiroseovarius crassostreae]
MTSEKTSGTGAGALVGGGAALALVLVALGWWVSRDTGAPATTGGQPQMVAEPGTGEDTSSTTTAPAPTDTAEHPGTDEADPAAQAPRFDVVRVDPDGAAVIAGQAPAGARVQILLDDTEAGQVEVDGSGNFVALLSLPPSDTPRVMKLMVDGQELRSSDESVIIGPIAAPVLATAEPEPDAPSAAPENDPAEDLAQSATDQDSGAQTGSPTVPQVLLADQEGIKVLQDAAGDTNDDEDKTVRIDSIAYDALGAVTLAGRSVAGATIQVFLDGAELMDTTVGEDGQWRMGLPAVAAGVYDLSVEARDANGTVLSRVETPFKREDPAQIATLSSEATDTSAPQPVSGAQDGAGTDGVASSQKTDLAATPDNQTAPLPEAQTVAEAGPAPDMGAEAEPAPATDAVQPDPAPSRPRLVTVQPGATLWAIARDNLGEGILYVQVFDANRGKIRNPDLIYPGQVFQVPAAN